MTALTIRQRAKVHASLVALYGHGIDASAVSAAAKALMKAGHTPALAFEQAINQALAGDPELTRSVSRVVAQVAASDDKTVAAYDHALIEYISTGDPAALAPVTGMAVRDAVALAVREGEISQADVDAGNIDWGALGMSADNAQVVYDTAPETPTIKSEFAFAAPGSQAAQPPETPGFIRTASGFRSAPIGEKARREAGVPILNGPIVRTASGGFRNLMTGEKAARWHGTPMALPGTPHAI